MIANIPHELRALPQWVCAGTDKQPLTPRTGQPASVTDPATWGTFEEAANTGFPHVGFVLSESDPYTIIDLDDPTTRTVNGEKVPEENAERVAFLSARHAAILESFASYSEVSQSGTGAHIIVRGEILRGVRRDRVEMYSDSRYMICTGRKINDYPIADRQNLLNQLFTEMDADSLNVAELVDVEGSLSDEELFNMASTAKNADKFLQLWRGEWEGNPLYTSQSEADFALLAMLGFYSPDNEQCRRVFRYSALGQRTKATKNNKYLNYALTKIRAKTPPPVDISALIGRGSALVPDQAPIVAKKPICKPRMMVVEVSPVALPQLGTSDEPTEYPPGFVGDAARYIFSSAIRPVSEIALAAAVALTAGVVGRAFNISGTGLNQYIILLAKTGSGKEGAATGIDALVNAVRPTVPMIDEFIGPGAFASGQALVRILDKSPCFVSVMGEFGLTLQQICGPSASSSQVMLKKVLLDIYAKSGHSKVLRPSVYSDSDKNTKSIQAPNVTILGESTPETFYTGLDASNIAEGLIPRFSIFEYNGPRPPSNPNAFTPPGEALVRAFGSLAAVAMQGHASRTSSPVQQDADAVKLFKLFDAHADGEINRSQADTQKQLWNRAHLKALKLAALIAVGCNPHQPIITREIAAWAIKFVGKDISRLLSKFESGEVGTGDVRLELDARKAILSYLKLGPEERAAYGCPSKMVTLNLIPFQFLRKRLRLLVDFKNDRRGATAALNQTLAAMVDGEILVRLGPSQARETCGTNSPVYGLGPAW